MAERHKYADVIIAWAEGKEIQCKYAGMWMDWRNSIRQPMVGPNFSTEIEWRIKPEKKTGWVNIYKTEKGSYCLGQLHSSEGEARITFGEEHVATVQIEWEES